MKIDYTIVIWWRFVDLDYPRQQRLICDKFQLLSVIFVEEKINGSQTFESPAYIV